MGIFDFWKRWDDDERASAVKLAGICITALAVFLFIASFSYLFHWQQDMSLPEVLGNKAGRLGYRTGRFLVGECFGLGSFGLLVFLGAAAARLLHRSSWPYPLLKTLLVTIGGTVVASLALAFIGRLLGLDYLFGGGLGGACGHQVIAWSISLLGTIVTGILVLILILALLFLSSRRFSRWFASLGERQPERQRPEKPAPDPDPVPESVDPDPQPVPDPDPVPDVDEGEDIPDSPLPPEDTQEPETPDPAAGMEIIHDDSLDKEVREPLKPIDNRLDPPDGLPSYKFPGLDLLDSHNASRHEVSTEELTRNNNKIRAALANYKIQVTDVKAVVGPTVTLYKVYPAPGVKIADIKKLQEDIALSLNAKGVRVVTLSDSVGIEVANDFSSIVPLKALLNDDAYRNSKADLPVAIGYTITQKVKVFDLAEAPHLLVAGATRQGKSVGLNVIVSSLLYSKHPSELKFVFIDPKMVEFSAYAQLLKHYLAVLPDAVSEAEERNNAIVKNPDNAKKILQSLCIEMDERYELLSKAMVNNIKLYNAKYKDRHLLPTEGHRYLPFLVVVVDEYADLTMSVGASPETKAASRSITNSIIRLAQKGRAAGIHVILATQRPSVDVISGLIKSNFPCRIAFRVASRVDSMTILDAPGAEKLIGKGDMLYSAGIDTERIQCAFVSNDEINDIARFVGDQVGYKKSYNTPYYLPSPAESGGEGGMIDMSDLDERFEEAARMVVTTQKGSTSDLQRRLGMGYAKAGRVMDQLEAAGIVGPQEGSKPRQVLIPDLNSLQPVLDAFRK
ncbi:MAG: DNA translocase FtsK 4TM domain-containing protein [Bacteroidales bacterium]|nr:DNA translocase FtsK 4TM domain-containing protein [Bacteroidales bacterium]